MSAAMQVSNTIFNLYHDAVPVTSISASVPTDCAYYNLILEYVRADAEIITSIYAQL